MINKLNLKNFKAFTEQSFTFNSLTLLSGLNSTGKSSVIQALLLLRQSYQQGLLPKKGLSLQGDLANIGTAQDALCEYAEENTIGFELTQKNGSSGQWVFDYNPQADILELKEAPSEDIYKNNLFHDNFHYLQAERLGPRPYFPMSDFQVGQHNQIGSQGQYTAHFLSMQQDQSIFDHRLSHPSATSETLKEQVEAWMSEVSPGTRIEIQSSSYMDLVSLQYSYGLSNPYRSTNVGFGITYTLPIIIAVLASTPETLILIENPESHLHPKGQAKLGELFAIAANCGIQIIVESHSDHVLNGIRLAVHSGKIEPEEVQLHYFQRELKNGQAITEVISPQIDRNGRIDQWPEGFFDEWDKSLMTLLRPRRD